MLVGIFAPCMHHHLCCIWLETAKTTLTKHNGKWFYLLVVQREERVGEEELGMT